MSIHRRIGKLVLGVALGIGEVAACAGAASSSVGPAAPAPAPEPASTLPVPEPLTEGPEAAEAVKRADAAKPKGDAGADNGKPSAPPRCPYGSLEDPHRGFVRCLGPDERDAGWLPPPPQREPSADNKPPPDKPPADKPAPDKTAAALPVVEVGAPKFENGQVPKAEKTLNGAADAIARCVADHGGLQGAAGSLKVQFLVRARGRAEGVEVLSAKGVSAEAAQCVRLLLKNKAVGAPSSDPVGVTVVLSLKAGK
jgi:hypothetical protein